MRADLEKGGWVALANVEPWIDDRFGFAPRVAAGWLDMDHALAEALKADAITARGWESVHRLLVRVEPGAKVVVRSLLRDVTVTTTTPGAGPAVWAPRVESRVYREVEVECESLGAWCALSLGPRLTAAPERGEVEPPSVRTKPRRGPVREIIARLFGEDWPTAPFDKRLVDRVGEALSADGCSASPSTIRRALRDGR